MMLVRLLIAALQMKHLYECPMVYEKKYILFCIVMCVLEVLFQGFLISILLGIETETGKIFRISGACTVGRVISYLGMKVLGESGFHFEISIPNCMTIFDIASIMIITYYICKKTYADGNQLKTTMKVLVGYTISSVVTGLIVISLIKNTSILL